jgi:hypothetical protein
MSDPSSPASKSTQHLVRAVILLVPTGIVLASGDQPGQLGAAAVGLLAACAFCVLAWRAKGS